MTSYWPASSARAELKPGFGVGEGDRGLALGRLPGVPAEQLHVVGVAARAAHQQAEGIVFPGHVAAGRRLDQGQARRARLQVAELFDREAAGVGSGAGQALPEGLEPGEDDGDRLEATGHHRLEGTGDRREVLLGCHLGLVDRDEQPGAVTGGEAAHPSQRVLEGSGGAPGADFCSSCRGRSSGAPWSPKRPHGRTASGMRCSRTATRLSSCSACTCSTAQPSSFDATSPITSKRTVLPVPRLPSSAAEAGVLGADLQHPGHVVYQGIAAGDYRRAASETRGVGRSWRLVSHR